MKFSVLLPTRNRLAYLKHAVETVRRQNYDDWEIVIADNDSEDDVAGYVAALDEPRIKYLRTDRFVSVTENWNNALEASSGDYVIMLGDDDGLLKNYFQAARALIEEHRQPDVLYTGAYLYAYPGAVAEFPDGYLHPYGYAKFLRGAARPYILDKRDATAVVAKAFDFRVDYGFNMQFVLVRRAFIDSLRARGPFFQSPFPDFYAMNVLFLTAGRVLACPDPMVVIGISPRSYGSYDRANREQEGIAFLGHSASQAVEERLRDTVLPGWNINTSWMYALETIRLNYGRELPVKINYRRYRILQIVYMYKNHYVEGTRSKEDLVRLVERMRPWERVVYGGVLTALFRTAQWVLPERRQRGIAYRLERWLGQFIRWDGGWRKQGLRDIVEVFEQMAPAGC